MPLGSCALGQTNYLTIAMGSKRCKITYGISDYRSIRIPSFSELLPVLGSTIDISPIEGIGGLKTEGDLLSIAKTSLMAVCLR
jgi:hypothetical protein